MRVFIFFLFTFIHYTVFSQLHHQTVSIGSSLIESSNFTISQTVGQLSPIGNYNSNGRLLFQGFQQPIIKIIKNNSYSLINTSTVAFPNPFNEKINFKFFNEHPDLLEISIFDINGKLISKFNQKSEGDILKLNLEGLLDSQYLIMLKSSEYFYSTKIIKKWERYFLWSLLFF